jgi:ABC-type uncharacterized transport system substrate-binding protein
MKAFLPPLALALAPHAAGAHPHVFIETAMEVVIEDDAVTAVRLTWTYDAFFSLLLTEDLGLDPDGDAVLTADEIATLSATLTQWPPEYAGDLVVTQGGVAQPLAERREHSITFEDGRVVEAHLRPLAQPVPADLPVVVENYDPYYYAAYTVLPEIRLSGGRGCAATLTPADPLAGQAEVDSIWQGLDIAGAGPEVELPPVGYAFADRVDILCGA